MDSAPSGNPTRSWTRLDGVDLLRALAIFFVLMNHVNIRLLHARVPYLKGLPHQLVNSLVWNGQFGVQIFFAVSGFLITSTTLRRWGSLAQVSVRDFYLLRFARIAPLLLLLLAVLSALHLAHFSDFVVPSKTGGLGRALVAALTFHVNVLEARRGYLPGNWDIIWSLSVEEMFYLFFPLVCFLLGRRKLLVALLLTFVVLGPFGRTVLAYGNEVWREYSYLAGMDAIALGCITALLVARHGLSRPVLLTIGSVGTVLLIFSLCFSIRANSWGLDRNGLNMTILALGTCMVTIMGLFAERHGIDLTGTKVSVGKEMLQEPVRRIKRLTVDIAVPLPATHPKKSALEKAALTCPVHESLHPDVEIPVNFHWNNSSKTE